jgi:hypothetical protein
VAESIKLSEFYGVVQPRLHSNYVNEGLRNERNIGKGAEINKAQQLK